MLKKLGFFILLISLFSCDKKSETEAKIEKVDADFELIRFDRKFAETSEENLPQQEIEAEIKKEFPEFTEENDELHGLFQHVKYYFPDFQVPDVITVTSEVDYKNKTIYTGEYLFVALDTYLGPDHKFYIGIQEFLKKNFRKEQIVLLHIEKFITTLLCFK